MFPATPQLGAEESAQLAARFKALADPIRVAIVNGSPRPTSAFYRLVSEALQGLRQTLGG
jgi:hypothetical protein